MNKTYVNFFSRREVGLKEYHDDLGVKLYLVLKWCVKHLSFTSLNAHLVVVTVTTQNKDFHKDHIEVYRALVDELLQFHQLK
jgi:hypothetical protein